LSPVTASTLDNDSVLGQRGRPSRVIRLLGLNAVGSKPARRANPEADRPYFAAKRSIPRHTSKCCNILGLHSYLPRRHFGRGGTSAAGCELRHRCGLSAALMLQILCQSIPILGMYRLVQIGYKISEKRINYEYLKR